jgi:hypothetical protein
VGNWPRDWSMSSEEKAEKAAEVEMKIANELIDVHGRHTNYYSCIRKRRFWCQINTFQKNGSTHWLQS